MKYKVDRLDVNIYASNKEMGQAAAKAIADDLCDDCQIGQYYVDGDEIWISKYVKGDYKPVPVKA